jgi:hypothetical protein
LPVNDTLLEIRMNRSDDGLHMKFNKWAKKPDFDPSIDKNISYIHSCVFDPVYTHTVL